MNEPKPGTIVAFYADDTSAPSFGCFIKRRGPTTAIVCVGQDKLWAVHPMVLRTIGFKLDTAYRAQLVEWSKPFLKEGRVFVGND